MFQFLHLLFLVTLCHCQDLDAIMAQFSDVTTEASVTEAADVTETSNYDVTTVASWVMDAAVTAPENQVENEAESSRRKRQDDTPESPANTDTGEAGATESSDDADIGGDLEAIFAQISEATQATELPSETATESVAAERRK